MQRRHFLVLLAAAALTPWPRPVPAADGNVITIHDYKFNPAELTVKVGTKVTWTNQDDGQHRVEDVSGLFKSDPLDADASFQYTYTKAGTYEYKCSFHSSMHGKVIVT